MFSLDELNQPVRIEYIGDEFDQEQSTDAAPLTELQDFYTLLHINSDCATGFTSVWTFCITVRDNICGEEFTRRCSDLSVCQTMDGAALVDDRSGVTFRAELCIPWDAPEAVVDIDSAEQVSRTVRSAKGCGCKSDFVGTRQQKRPVSGPGQTRGRPWLPRRNSGRYGR